MKRRLHDAWRRLVSRPPRSFADRVCLGVLSAVSAIYGAGVAARNAAYDWGWAKTVRLSRPVISIGNLSVGGTGKTACTEYVAQKLLGQGRRVAILSRGYGSRIGSAPYVLCVQEGRLLVNGQAASTNANHLPDEPQLLAWHLPGVPVVVGLRRDVAGALAIEGWQADVLVMDDGLQHRRLARSLEIVLIAATMPLSGWPLLPRGPMREGLASLRRADVIIITKADQAWAGVAALQEHLSALNPAAVVATAAHDVAALQDAEGGVVPLERLGGLSVALLSGVGDPEGFEQTVRRVGASVASHAAYPDHHRYALRDWQAAAQAAQAAHAAALITTEKDWMRLRPLLGQAVSPIPVWVLPVRFRLLSGEEHFNARLAAVFAR